MAEAKKKWHGIVERGTTADQQIQHWYFSEDGVGGWYVSGYRLYEKQADGSFIITKRYYPKAHLLVLIPAEEVPMPVDVVSEVKLKGDAITVDVKEQIYF